jgi:acyl-coenzyme A synthetase/AMP-(fatty) acid ligase
LNQHPSVFESAVIGVQDPARGEVPIAFVELRDGEVFDAASLRAHCRSTLPQYKVPRAIHHIDSLPRNATGKVLRRMLRDPEADRGVDSERGNRDSADDAA